MPNEAFAKPCEEEGGRHVSERSTSQHGSETDGGEAVEKRNLMAAVGPWPLRCTHNPREGQLSFTSRESVSDHFVDAQKPMCQLLTSENCRASDVATSG